MSSTATPTSPSKAGTGRWRLLQFTAPLYFIAVLVQIYLGGAGVFGASGTALDTAKDLDVHRALGNALGILALVVLIGAAITRSRKVIIVAVVAFLLTGVTGVLASGGIDTPALGGIHVVVGLLIAGLAGYLAHQAFRNADARGTDPS